MKIGVLGMSPGNAHPYSWSAIVNGQFDADEITKVGYPAVAAYLEANKQTLGVSGAKVTCVWAQEKAIAESIAYATGIKHVADSPEKMVGMVDAVLLMRDDPENHVEMSRPFIDAGIPIFVDKPLAVTIPDLEYFANESAKGKIIMSSSSMRYSSETMVVKQEMELGGLGKIELITGVGKKDWNKYGVHHLEALFTLMDDARPVSVRHIGETNRDVVQISFANGVTSIICLFMDIAGTLQLSVFGQNAWRMIDAKNSYCMFRDNAVEFIRSVSEGKARLSFDKTENIIRTLIAANDSLAQGGKLIEF